MSHDNNTALHMTASIIDLFLYILPSKYQLLIQKPTMSFFELIIMRHNIKTRLYYIKTFSIENKNMHGSFEPMGMSYLHSTTLLAHLAHLSRAVLLGNDLLHQ